MAACSGCGKSMKVLISAGADVNLKSIIGVKTLKVEAATVDHRTCKYISAKAGADVNLRCSQYGNRALMKAALLGYDKTVEMLVRAGAIVNLRNNKGVTALMVTRKLGHHKCVKVLTQAESYPKKIRLEHLCRIAIRKHLLQTSGMSLFDAVPKLGLEHLSEFLLFSEIFDEDVDDDEAEDKEVPSS